MTCLLFTIGKMELTASLLISIFNFVISIVISVTNFVLINFIAIICLLLHGLLQRINSKFNRICL